MLCQVLTCVKRDKVLDVFTEKVSWKHLTSRLWVNSIMWDVTNINHERERIELVLRNHNQHSNPYLTLSDPIQTASINQMINCLCDVKELNEGFDSDYCYKCGKLKGFLGLFRFSLRGARFQLKIIRTMWDGHKAFILNLFPDRV